MTPAFSDGVTLAAMLAHPSWSDVSLLAGEPSGRGRLEGSRVTRDALAAVPDASGCLLVVLSSADRSDWHVDSLVNRAAAAGTAAVMLDGHAPVRRSTQLLSGRLGLPVLGALDALAAHQALDRLVHEPSTVLADLVQRVVVAGRHSSDDVDSLVDRLSSALARPVALLTPGGEVTAGRDVVDDGDRAVVAARLDVTAARVPAPTVVPLRGGRLLVAHPVAVAGVTSWLTCRLPLDLLTERRAVEAALSVGGAWVERRLALLRVTLERSARRRTSLLGEVLQGKVTGSTARSAVDIGWQLDGWHTGIRIGVGQHVDVAGRRNDVVAAFDAEGLAPVVVEQDAGWAAWTTAHREPTTQQVQELASRVRQVQRRLVSSLDPYVGVGRVHIGPQGIGRSLGEATDAARLAQARVTQERFLHVDRLGLAQLLLAWTQTDTFQPAARALLEPLRAQPGELVQTLATYLDNESSVAHTADVLGVHRNTVAARVARIRDVLGVDLADADERLALHLACRTELMLGRGRES